jgi:hypothetical protein
MQTSKQSTRVFNDDFMVDEKNLVLATLYYYELGKK